MVARQQFAVAGAVLCALACAALVVSTYQLGSSDEVELNDIWAYSGDTGPNTWGKVAPACSKVKLQSPVNIVPEKADYDYELEPLSWTYEHGKKQPSIVFNGHTVLTKGNYATLHWKNMNWELMRFEFHTPAENRINGMIANVELQMIHRSSKGTYLIVSWLMSEEKWAAAYIPSLADHFPTTRVANHPSEGPDEVEFTQFIELITTKEKGGQDYYTFQGSLTAPPCTGGVTWIVMTEILGINHRDVGKLKHLEGTNNRPVQSLNGRKVWKSFPEANPPN